MGQAAADPVPGRQPRPTVILIVDDDAGQRGLLDTFLRAHGFTTLTAASGEQALDILRTTQVGMIISDVRMPGMSGLEMLRAVRSQHATLPVLLVTGFADIREAVGAMRDGAVNYLPKPIDLDELLSSTHLALGLARSGSPPPPPGRPLPPHCVARSPLMQALLHDAALIAASESRVLITGESGVGKEVLADILHAWSPRAQGPMVKVNCAAIPENLLESELFGHEKGAFTGAVAQRLGRFELARAGTIFLDEIGDMSAHLQAKLLRVTQDGRFQRVGGNQEIHADARIIAATNRDLEREVRAGRFREDLFYRLNVVELSLPPLRERPEDILPLAQLFLSELAPNRARLSPAATLLLERHPWPGNIRELRNAMERAALLSRGDVILPEHLPTRVRGEAAGTVPTPATDASRLEEIERHTILQTLAEHGYNRSETARVLGISRRALIYKLQHFRELGFPVDAPSPP